MQVVRHQDLREQWQAKLAHPALALQLAEVLKQMQQQAEKTKGALYKGIEAELKYLLVCGGS